MSTPRASFDLSEALYLRQVRRFLRRSHALAFAAFLAMAYALASMLWGGMLTLAPLHGGTTVEILTGSGTGQGWWNYPGLLVVAPWGVLSLPFFPTVAMVVVAVGVGLGMAVAAMLIVRLLRPSAEEAARSKAVGAVTGLTPAMIALVTLGACCSTTAAATAGVGLVAQASGSSTSNLLFNNWFLGAFQIVVVYVALLAQELLLRVYGTMFGAADPGVISSTVTESRPIDRRAVASSVLRVGLVAAGITWGLAVLADWTVAAPLSASAGLWFNWLVEHWLIGGLAVFVALAPRPARDFLLWFLFRRDGYIVRGLLLVGAWSLAVWVPPPLSGVGVEGFGNELLGLLGVGPGFGGVGPGLAWGVGLLLRWVFQYLLLGGFAAAVALSPRRTLDWVAETDRIATYPAAPGPAAPPTSAIPSNTR